MQYWRCVLEYKDSNNCCNKSTMEKIMARRRMLWCINVFPYEELIVCFQVRDLTVTKRERILHFPCVAIFLYLFYDHFYSFHTQYFKIVIYFIILLFILWGNGSVFNLLLITIYESCFYFTVISLRQILVYYSYVHCVVISKILIPTLLNNFLFYYCTIRILNFLGAFASVLKKDNSSLKERQLQVFTFFYKLVYFLCIPLHVV